jgi:solute carrier family 35, member F5
LFILFTLSIGLIIKGISLFPQSSYCGSIGLLGILALMLMILGMKTESITRYKIIAIILLTFSALITIFEPVVWDKIDIISFLNYGLALSIAGVLLLALFFVVLCNKIEHTHIYKPMLFGFIGLFCMLVMWLVFIPLHIYNLEPLKFPPPKEEVYWYIIGIIALGTVIPFYLIQWVLTKTSILFVCVLLGSIIPLHGIAEAVYFLEWNWINLLASSFSLAAIIMINYRYK